MALHNNWANMILNGSKPLEFRNSIGKDFEIGNRVYIYETSKYGGRKKVVGEFKIKDIVKIPKAKCGTYFFLEYFCKNIKKDDEALKAVRKIYSINLEHYDNSLKLSYIFLPEIVEAINKDDSAPDILNMSREEFNRFNTLQDKSIALTKECDNWLSSIGFYDEYGESYYNYYIEIKDTVAYDTPLDLSNFEGADGKIISTPPQGFRYCKKI